MRMRAGVAFLFFLVATATAALYVGAYQLQEGKQAVVTQFGALAVAQVGQGPPALEAHLEAGAAAGGEFLGRRGFDREAPGGRPVEGDRDPELPGRQPVQPGVPPDADQLCPRPPGRRSRATPEPN